MTPWPIEIATDGHVSCGIVLWQFRQRLQMTVVAKATFALVAGGDVTPLPPAEIVREDQTYNRQPTRSVQAAADVAPYLPRCDVTFVGHAHVQGEKPTSAARLALFRDTRPLLDKTLHVFGDRDPSGAPRPFQRMPLVYERAWGGPGVDANLLGSDVPNVVDPADPKRVASFAPVGRFWPARKRLLGALARRSLEAPVPEIPEAMPWAYFQAAPPDQQIDHLQGGEWLVLDGLHPTLPRLQTRLPLGRAEVRVRMRGAPHAGGTKIDLVADTLAIDGDLGRCSIVWRGRHEVQSGQAALSTLVVAAGLSLPGRPVAWEALAASPRPGAAAPAATPKIALDTTVSMPPDQSAAAAQKAAVPFAPSPSPSPAPPAAKPAQGQSWVTAEMKAVPAHPTAPFAVMPPGANATSAAAARAATPWGGAQQPPAAPPGPWTGSPTTQPIRIPIEMMGSASPGDAAADTPPLETAAPAPPADSPLASKLRSAGASADDVAALMAALNPAAAPAAKDKP